MTEATTTLTRAVPNDYQLFIDLLHDQQSQQVRMLQARRDRAWAELTESIAAWKKSPGPGNDLRLASLAARLNDLPETISVPPLDTGFFIDRLSQIDAEIEKYRDVLSIKRRQIEFIGEYGEIEDKKWIKEIFRFLERNPIVSVAITSLQAATKDAALDVDWTTSIAKRINEQISPAAALPSPNSERSDGVAYEHSCLLALQKIGWAARLTPPTGDQGVDILAKKRGVSVAIQCKNYRGAVGNKAIQEVHAGKAFYEADVAVVVSPSGYTASAMLLAKKLQVLLIDHASLSQLERLAQPLS